MKEKTIFKRAVATLLTMSLMTSMFPTAAFAAPVVNEDGAIHAKRHEVVPVEMIVDNFAPDKSGLNNIIIEKDINGEVATKTIAVDVSEAGDWFLDGVSAKEKNGFAFAESMMASIAKGTGTVKGDLDETAKAAFEALLAAVDTAKAEVEAAQVEVEAAQKAKTDADLAAAVPTAEKTVAENLYNDAVTKRNEAEAALIKANDDLANYEDRIEQKKAELAAEKTANNETLAKIGETETAINDAIAKTGYTREQLADCAANNIHSHKYVNTCKIALSAIEGLEGQLDNQKAQLEESNAKIVEQEEYLAANDTETVRIPFENAVEEAEKALNEAELNFIDAEAEYQEKLPAYNAAVAAVNAAQDALNEKQAAKAEKEDALAVAVGAARSFINNLTVDDITWDPAKLTYAPTNETYDFDVVVYDEVAIKFVDELNTIDNVPAIAIEGDVDAVGTVTEETTKVRVNDGDSIKLAIPAVDGHKFAVTGATLNGEKYVAGPFDADDEVVVTYTEIGASKILYEAKETATITVTSEGANVPSGTTVKPGKEVNVLAEAKGGYEIAEVIVKDKAGVKVLEGNGAFTTNANDADEYTITVTTKLLGAIVKEGEHDARVTDVEILVNDQPYTPGDMILPGVAKVTLIPTVTPGWRANGVEISVDGASAPEVTHNDNEFYFETIAGQVYTVAFTENDGRGIIDVHSIINPVTEKENSDVVIKVDGEEYVDGTEILPGAQVEVAVTPAANYYVSYLLVNELARSFMADYDAVDGTFYARFTVGEARKYTIMYDVATPVLAPNEKPITINNVDIANKKFDVVKDALYEGFDRALNATMELNYEYLAGEIKVGNAGTIPVWLPIEQEFDVNKAADKVWDVVNDISPALGSLFPKTEIVKLLNAATDAFHDFGEQDVEKVRAVFGGNKNFLPVTTAGRDVNIVDARTEVILDVNAEVSVTYGKYEGNADIIEKLLEGKNGVMADGVKLGDDYNKEIVLNMDLADANAGEYTVEVSYPGNDFYKDTEKQTVKVKVLKGEATVTVTKNNLIAYEHIDALTKDYLVQVAPEDVEHIAFIMGLDANINDPAKPEFFAKIDLSQTSINSELAGYNIADVIAKQLDPEGDGIALSELKEKLPAIKELLKSLNLGDAGTMLEDYVDTAMVVAAIEKAMEAFEEFTEYGDVRIYFVNDEEAVVPESHGAYIIGAVTTDRNYNMAANAGPIVISAKPATVKFEGVDENNNAKFEYDGDAKSLVAKAYDENGNELTGTFKYLYGGIDGLGRPYYGTEAPVNTGAYTVLAVFTDNAKHYAGFGIATILIEGADITITAEDKEVTCGCGCDEVTCEKDPCYKEQGGTAEFIEIAIESALDRNAAINYVTIIEDGRGGINVIMPEGGEHAKYGINDLLAKIPGFDKLGDVEEAEALKEFIENWMNENGYEAAIEFNGPTPTRCGKYKVTIIAYGENHDMAVKKVNFVITPAEHVCDGGEATCITLAKCEVCGEDHGDYDRDNHEKEEKWVITDKTHTKVYECCGAVTYATEEHKGGKATCTEKAKCEVCEAEYGELDKDNHTKEAKWTITDKDHEKVYECCGAHEVEKGEHKGGKATCQTKAKCEVCDAEYGDLNPDVHTKGAEWDIDDKTHEKKYDCCGKVVVEKGEHKGGTATTTKKAKCEVCGHEYGDLKKESNSGSSASQPSNDNPKPTAKKPDPTDKVDTEEVEDVVEEEIIPGVDEPEVEEAPVVDAPVEEEVEKTGFPWMILIGAVVGGVALWGIFILLKKKDDDEDDEI